MKREKENVGGSIARMHIEGKTRKIVILAIMMIVLIAAVIIGITMTNAAGNTAAPETEQTFTEEGDGYYIWVRAVDYAGNKGPWSEAQRVWIDTGAPKITIKTNSNTTWAQTGSVTVALQDSKSGLASGAKLKYGWSTSTSTAPSKYTDVTPSYTAGTTSEVTFTAEASGLTGKYYLWVVPTTLADTAGNTQTETVKSTGQFYFDNKGPTAGTATMKLGSSSGSAYSNDSWTNQSVYVAKNNGSDGSGESGHSSTTWTIAGTAESGTSKTLDPGSGKSATYSIVVTTADVAGNTASNTYTVKIDRAGPSAPTITGGSTTYATSQKIKVSTASTDTGVGTVSFYEYYKASDGTAPTASTSGTSVTTSDNSVTFSENIAGHYVYFRAVDGVGNKGAWSSAARVYVDVNSPTVSAKNSSVTITAGDNVAMSTYFTTSANGNAAISSTTYKIGSASYTNTSSLAAGTYTVTCTVTKVGGKTASASMTLVVEAKVVVPVERTTLYNLDTIEDTQKTITFTVPDGVTVLELFVGMIAWNDYEADTWVGHDKVTWWSGNAIDEEQDYCWEKYIKVTPGKTYTLTISVSYGEAWMSIFYSQSINNESPNMTDL